jgi:hypothetical protein
VSAQSAAKLVGITVLQSAAAPSPLGPPAVLEELAQRFHVNWVVLPEVISSNGEKHRVGFVIELEGRHHSAKCLARDCERCRRVGTVLRLITDWVLPCSEECSDCDVQIITPFVTGAAACAKGLPVTLTVRVLHAAGNGMDLSCKSDCLALAEARLRELMPINAKFTK